MYKALWAGYRLQFLPNHFQTSHVSCVWWEEEPYWFWVIGQGQLCPPARGCHTLRCLVLSQFRGIKASNCCVTDPGWTCCKWCRPTWLAKSMQWFLQMQVDFAHKRTVSVNWLFYKVWIKDINAECLCYIVLHLHWPCIVNYPLAAMQLFVGEWPWMRFALWARYRLVFAQSLSNFTCKLLMMIRWTLFIFDHRVKGQGHIWHCV